MLSNLIKPRKAKKTQKTRMGWAFKKPPGFCQPWLSVTWVTPIVTPVYPLRNPRIS